MRRIRLCLLPCVVAAWSSGACRRGEGAPPPVPPSAADAGAPRTPSTPVLRVPRVSPPPKADGEADEPAWRDPARTGPFVEPGGGAARPYSDARLLWDDENLYVVLYAADEDIRAPAGVHDAPLEGVDAFRMRLEVPGVGAFQVEVAASGAVSDARVGADGRADRSWESGARAAVDLDGSLNVDDGEEDEEWVVEAAIPWKALGVAPGPSTAVGFSASRCDTPRDGTRRCGESRPVVLSLVR